MATDRHSLRRELKHKTESFFGNIFRLCHIFKTMKTFKKQLFSTFYINKNEKIDMLKSTKSSF